MDWKHHRFILRIKFVSVLILTGLEVRVLLALDFQFQIKYLQKLKVHTCLPDFLPIGMARQGFN